MGEERERRGRGEGEERERRGRGGERSGRGDIVGGNADKWGSVYG